MSCLPKCHAPLIVTLDEDRGEGSSGSKVTSEHLRAGRKRARKLRQRMAARLVGFVKLLLLYFVCVCVCVCVKVARAGGPVAGGSCSIL